MKTYKQLQERINMARAKMGDVIKDFQQSDAPQFKGKSQEKRRQMAIAAKMAAEEVEQIDELSKETLASYAGKAAKDFAERKPKMGYKGQLKKMQNRSVGVGRALDKVYGEEVELEEGRMKEIAMDMETLGDKEFKAKHRKSKQDMKDALSSKPTNEEVESIDEISTNLAIRARSKALSDTSGKDRSKLSKLALDKWTGKAKVGSGKYNTNEEVEQIEESDLKPFIVVHAKHGKFETHAASTYEAAKNAAAHWKTKKGTAGMDVHRADITHSTQHVG